MALSCGTPPPMNPPPPPPAPPIVCCQVIDRVPCPIDPCNFEYWIVCYGRIDGLPLFNSNPMALTPGQACGCAVPPLNPAAVAAGATVVGLWFTDPTRVPWDPTQIPNEPGYGPFEPEPDPNIQFQVDSFFDIYYQAAGIVPDANPLGVSSLFSFRTGAAGGQILPGLVFNVYTCIRVPRNFPPDALCTPLQEGGIGLFMIEPTGEVLLEPLAPGLAPIPAALFAPGDGAFYKFRWYPVSVPPSCPPPFPPDINSDGLVDTADLGTLIANFGMLNPCP
jgi:hypothetical protein